MSMVRRGAQVTRQPHHILLFDAHGGSSLPLAQELDVIFAQCPPAIVMIDDFEVPGDEAYGYDDYGPGNALTPDYIADAMQAYALAAFYPAAPAVEETGARRGCVILVRRAIHGTVLASLHLLRPAAGRFEAETTTGISSNTAYPAMTRWAKDCSVTFRHIQEGWLAANLSIRVTPERGPGVPAGFGFKASDIRRLHGEGIGPTEIAKRLGISRASVYRVLNLSV